MDEDSEDGDVGSSTRRTASIGKAARRNLSVASDTSSNSGNDSDYSEDGDNSYSLHRRVDRMHMDGRQGLSSHSRNDDYDDDGDNESSASSSRSGPDSSRESSPDMGTMGSSGPVVDDDGIFNLVVSLKDEFKPLWRFRCKYGKERTLCTRLQSKANDRLRSLNLSFKSFQGISGWVYVAGQPRSHDLCRWIKDKSTYVTRGIGKVWDADMICECVEEDTDFRASSNANANNWSSQYLYKWVRILPPGGRGTTKPNGNEERGYNYAGEIGLVIQTSRSGKAKEKRDRERVKVLLVPRIPLSLSRLVDEEGSDDDEYPSSSSSSRSSPALSEASSSASSSSTTNTRKRKRACSSSPSSSSSHASAARAATSTSTTTSTSTSASTSTSHTTAIPTYTTDSLPLPPHRLFNPTEIRQVYGFDSVVAVRGKGAGTGTDLVGGYWFQPNSKSSKRKRMTETEKERERYQNGLLVRRFRVNQIRLLDGWDRDGIGDGVANTIPFSLYKLFRQSGHEDIPEDIKCFPRIKEWAFGDGDRVRVRDKDCSATTTTGSGSRSENGNGNGEKGVVGTVLRSRNDGHVEVNFGLGTSIMPRNGAHEGGIPFVNAAAAANPYLSANANIAHSNPNPYVQVHTHTYNHRYVGLQSIPWWNLVKVFNIGDYVSVMGGIHNGSCGWIVSGNGDGNQDGRTHTTSSTSASGVVHANGGRGQKRAAHWSQDEVVQIVEKIVPGTVSDGGVKSITVHANFVRKVQVPIELSHRLNHTGTSSLFPRNSPLFPLSSASVSSASTSDLGPRTFSACNGAKVVIVDPRHPYHRGKCATVREIYRGYSVTTRNIWVKVAVDVCDDGHGGTASTSTARSDRTGGSGRDSRPPKRLELDYYGVVDYRTRKHLHEAYPMLMEPPRNVTIPWKGQTVTIIQAHPDKGKEAVVMDVVPFHVVSPSARSTNNSYHKPIVYPSGIRVTVQLSGYTNARHNLDYYGVATKDSSTERLKWLGDVYKLRPAQACFMPKTVREARRFDKRIPEGDIPLPQMMLRYSLGELESRGLLTGVTGKDGNKDGKNQGAGTDKNKGKDKDVDMGVDRDGDVNMTTESLGNSSPSFTPPPPSSSGSSPANTSPSSLFSSPSPSPSSSRHSSSPLPFHSSSSSSPSGYSSPATTPPTSFCPSPTPSRHSSSPSSAFHSSSSSSDYSSPAITPPTSFCPSPTPSRHSSSSSSPFHSSSSSSDYSSPAITPPTSPCSSPSLSPTSSRYSSPSLSPSPNVFVPSSYSFNGGALSFTTPPSLGSLTIIDSRAANVVSNGNGVSLGSPSINRGASSSTTPLPPGLSRSSAIINRASSVVSDSGISLGSPEPDMTNHWILHPNLLNKKIEAIAHGGGYLHKEVTVIPQMKNGEVEVIWTYYKKPQVIPPRWLYPRHPNHARYNGLSLVVGASSNGGEQHIGKYVRRYNHARCGCVHVAVVDHVEGMRDSLTNELLCVKEENLCVAHESVVDRESNKGLLRGMKRKYHKTHRKNDECACTST